MMNTGEINIIAGWIGMLCGVISGVLLGFFFHKDAWMGGYNSFRRRICRLGHISFFGLGFINLFFGVTQKTLDFPLTFAHLASLSFIVGAVTMPLCCFITAWKERMRHFFPIPVISVALGLIILLFGGGG